MSEFLMWHVIEGAALGLGAGLAIWLLRNFEPVRRVRFSAWIVAILLGLAVIVRGSGLPAEDTAVKIIAAIAIMMATYTGLQLIDLLALDYVLGRRRHVMVPRLLVDLFNLAVLLIVALAVLNTVFGVELGAFVITSTVLSAVIGLALQDILGNVVAGIALQIEQPFSVGDWVSVSGQEGQVVQMNWRTLTVQTRSNNTATLPNGSIARQEIVNYSRPTPLQQAQVTVGVAYRHPPEKVKASLVLATSGAAGVLAEPAPDVLLTQFGENAVQYQVRFWISAYGKLPEISDAVLTRIWYRLKRDNIDIPFPTRDVTVRSLPEDYESRLQQKRHDDVFSELRRLPLFKPLSDDQVQQLSQGADMQRYAAGEILAREGDQGDSLYTLKSGRVRVERKGDGLVPRLLATLGPANFFGEMSLMTGEPRNASVIAETEVEVVIVDRADLSLVLETDTHLAEALSVILAARTLAGKEEAAADGQGATTAPVSSALLTRIRGFFGLR